MIYTICTLSCIVLVVTGFSCGNIVLAKIRMRLCTSYFYQTLQMCEPYALVQPFFFLTYRK
uniref:Uncharacterized protein n=1 Tax=Rhizophora mucronata TaxID=61149 RepID=A0A2P2NMV3_RHIMU